MPLQILESAQTDLANSVLQSPVSGNPYYFFFGSVRPWVSNFVVTAITKANPAQITIDPGHDVVVGETITFAGIAGMSAINGLVATVTVVTGAVVTATVDTTTFGTFVLGGGYLSVTRTTASETKVAESVRHSIAGLKVVTGSEVCHVVPRIDWQAGQVYDAYDPSASMDGKNFYTLASGRLYICLNNAGGVVTSYQAPQGTSSKAVTLDDGYTWKFVQEVATADMTKFGDASWIPVRPLALPSAEERNSIEAIRVVQRGTGYAHNDAITIVGDGSGATATIRKFFSSGVIYSLAMTTPGQSYTWASAVITSTTGSGAVLEPVISWGFGSTSDPVHALRAKHIKFVMTFDGTENGSLYVGPIHSIGLLKPVPGALTTTVVDARSQLAVVNNGTAFSVGDTIIGQISGTSAVVAGTSENALDYLEEQGTGFIAGEIVVASATKTAIVTSVATFDRTKIDDAEIVFLEALPAVLTRNVGQIDTFSATVGY